MPFQFLTVKKEQLDLFDRKRRHLPRPEFLFMDFTRKNMEKADFSVTNGDLTKQQHVFYNEEGFSQSEKCGDLFPWIF